MGPGVFFPTNPDLADILGRTDFDFENSYFLDFVGSQISRFPGPRFPKNLPLGRAWALGRAGPWAGLGPSAGRAAGGSLGWAARLIRHVSMWQCVHSIVGFHRWGLTEILLGLLAHP